MAILTVSRKVGSLGDEIARAAADRLGYRLISREDFQNLAKQCDTGFKDACEAFETEVSGSFVERFFFRDPAYTALFEALNLELAAAGDVVILGRGAQIVLAGEPGVCKLRVVAPTHLRVERIAKRQGVGLEEAGEFVRHYDQQRRSLIESVFHKNLSDWSLYDLVINTAEVSLSLAVEIMTLAVGQFGRDHNREELAAHFANKAFAKRVESAIKRRIPTAPYRDVVVSCTEPGNLVLTGFVQDRRSREMAEHIAREQPGVGQVDNKLRTTELSF